MTIQKKYSLKRIEGQTSLILEFFLPTYHEEYKTCVKTFFGVISHRVTNQGLEHTIKWLKATRLCVTRYITGYPILTYRDGPILVDLLEGWPRWLSDFKPLIHTPEGIRYLFTLLVCLRGLTLKPVLDVTPIISPWKGTDTITSTEFDHACHVLGCKPLDNVEWTNFHLPSKVGPSGPAMARTSTQLSQLPNDVVDNIQLLGGPRIAKVIAQARAKI